MKIWGYATTSYIILTSTKNNWNPFSHCFWTQALGYFLCGGVLSNVFGIVLCCPKNAIWSIETWFSLLSCLGGAQICNGDRHGRNSLSSCNSLTFMPFPLCQQPRRRRYLLAAQLAVWQPWLCWRRRQGAISMCRRLQYWASIRYFDPGFLSKSRTEIFVENVVQKTYLQLCSLGILE